MISACRWAQKPSIMAEKPRFWRQTVFAKNLGFGVGFGYRNNTTANACGAERKMLASACTRICLVVIVKSQQKNVHDWENWGSKELTYNVRVFDCSLMTVWGRGYHHFVWSVCCVIVSAAEHGNIEALIKLGIAYLYNEGCKYYTAMWQWCQCIIHRWHVSS